MRKVRFYYADTDDLEILCVDQVGPDANTEEQVSYLANQYPRTIYFAVEEEE